MIHTVDWQKTLEQYRGRWCTAGADLASVEDLTCCAYLFPHDNDRETVDLILRTWCCEKKIHDKKNKYRDQYIAWAEAGWIQETGGDAIDYHLIRKQIVEDSKIFDIGLIGIDRGHQGFQFAMDLMEELGHTDKNPRVIACTNHKPDVWPVLQEFERRLLSKKIHHGSNPILRFMVDSCALSKPDSDGNCKIDKAASQAKIDGVMSTIYALGRLMKSRPKKSAYEGKTKKEILERLKM